jgi:hypothetical protein
MPLWKVAAMLAGLHKIDLEVESGHNIPEADQNGLSSVSNPNSPMADQHVINLHAATAVLNGAGALGVAGFNSYSPSSNADATTADGQPRRKKTKKRKKCPHNRERYRCKDCKGSSICPHNRVKSQCKDCGGSQICEVSLPICTTLKSDLSRNRVVRPA